LGVSTCEPRGWKNPAQIADSQFQDATGSQPTWYRSLEAIDDWLEMDAHDHLVDLGCGRGRVLVWAAQQGQGRVSGVEADPDLVSVARSNLEGLRVPSRIHCQDAADYRFSDETILFFFNPFGAFTMAAVVDNLAKNLVENPRQLRIIYRWNHHQQLFETLPGAECVETRGRDSYWRITPPRPA
tara:strand:- start:821 stop:1372 length:552 start_codon:yes stop_codon:yes gene_type:complete